MRVTCAALLSLLLIGCGRSARSYLDKGNALYAEGKFADAELNYRKALQADPKNGEACHRLGLAAWKQDKTADAYQALSMAVQLMPENQPAQVDLASFALPLYLQDPRRPKVLYDLLTKLSTELLRKDAHSYDGLRVKGYLALVDHRPEEAEPLFRRANDVKPRQQSVVVGWMEALIEENRTAEAEKLGLDTIAVNKKAGEVYDALYRLYTSTNRAADAENILSRKARDNPSESFYSMQLASYYAHSRKITEMAAALQPMLDNPSSFPRAYLDAGDLYLSVGDRSRAIELFRAGATAHPKESALYEDRIARVLLLENKRDEAAQLLEGVLKAYPDDTEARALRGVTLLGNPGANPSQGIGEFQTLVDKHPDDVFLRYLLARALFDVGNLAAARPQLLEVTRKDPGFLIARLNLADLELRQGDFNGAVQAAQAALGLDPTDFQARFIQGSAFERSRWAADASRG